MQTRKERGLYRERGTDPGEGWGDREERDVREVEMKFTITG